jgi:hypothetical protein
LTISHNKLPEIIFVALLACFASSLSSADESINRLEGHTKTRLLADVFPSNSIFNDQIGSTAVDLETDLRLNFSAVRDAWSFDAAWQLYAGYGDRIEFSQLMPATDLFFTDSSPSDDRRLMNLTDTIHDEDSFRALHRLDRLSVGYTTDNVVLRVGRQAISWGNGLIFSPMDIVSPFDPTAVDTEYKVGDDMIYGQFLFANSNDIQVAHVFRRNALSAAADTKSATTAIKYHGIHGDSEYDLLIAQSYDELTIGLGGNMSIGGAVWRGDVVLSDTESGNKVQLVSNLSYSWVLGGRNMSGIVEFYFNGFGQRGDRYDPIAIAQNLHLARRLERGEIFTLGRNYLAGGVSIEVNPLWTLMPNLFANLDDGSALFQVTSRYSLGDNSELLAAINVPLGPPGTEFGGISTGQVNSYFSTELSLFAQFAWYF